MNSINVPQVDLLKFLVVQPFHQYQEHLEVLELHPVVSEN